MDRTQAHPCLSKVATLSLEGTLSIETNFEFPASKSVTIAAKFCCSCGAKNAIRGYLINLVFFYIGINKG